MRSVRSPGRLPPLVTTCGVVLPRYGSIDADEFGLQPVASLEVPMGVLGRIPVTVLQGEASPSKARTFFIGYDPYYARRGIYGHDGDGFTDNDLRFTLLSRAALEIARQMGWRPDVVHAHDWHTAAIPAFLRAIYRDDPVLSEMPQSLLTIHNMLHQGVFDKSLMDVLGIGWEHFQLHELEFFDKVNLMKGGDRACHPHQRREPDLCAGNPAARSLPTGSRASCGSGPPICPASSTARTTANGTPRRTRSSPRRNGRAIWRARPSARKTCSGRWGCPKNHPHRYSAS